MIPPSQTLARRIPTPPAVRTCPVLRPVLWVRPAARISSAVAGLAAATAVTYGALVYLGGSALALAGAGVVLIVGGELLVAVGVEWWARR